MKPINKKIVNLIQELKLLIFDFDGVFTDNIVYTSESGKETVACWRSDGLGLSKIKKIGIPIWVISTETNPVVSQRCAKLDINCIQGCDDKFSAILELNAKYQCDLRHTAFIGNDVNDLECLERVGLPIIVADSHKDICHLGLYKTESLGGRGAVREVCDLILKFKN
jgi:3-deoxy-D-manno-octulosonate 8-phosphate phosphatase (KDO 8-P phosphatase)